MLPSGPDGPRFFTRLLFFHILVSHLLQNETSGLEAAVAEFMRSLNVLFFVNPAKWVRKCGAPKFTPIAFNFCFVFPVISHTSCYFHLPCVVMLYTVVLKSVTFNLLKRVFSKVKSAVTCLIGSNPNLACSFLLERDSHFTPFILPWLKN